MTVNATVNPLKLRSGARTLERLATLATEVHPLFNRYFHVDDFSADAGVQGAVKARGTEKLLGYFRQQDASLRTPCWSGGDDVTAADLYFMVVARWGRWGGVGKLSPHDLRRTSATCARRRKRASSRRP